MVTNFFLMVRTLKIYSLSNFPIYNRDYYSVVKNSPDSAGDMSSIPGEGNGNPL